MNKLTEKDKQFVFDIEKEVNFSITNPTNIKLYTEEDLRKAIKMARSIKDSESEFEIEDISGFTEICTYGWKEKYTDNEIIQSLQPKRPKYFECEMARITKFNGEPDYFEPNSKPNSQGQTELAGEYIF